MGAVTVTLHGTLNRYLADRGRTVQLDLQGPATAAELLERLGVPVGELELLLINGERVSPEAPLAEGDRVEVFPFLGGGADIVW